METRELNKNVHFDGVKCELCGCESFFELPKPRTIWGCNGIKNGQRCKGIICKCSKCNKIYMSDHFGQHGDVWECKTCNTVQWEYTDMMKLYAKMRAQASRAHSLRNEIESLKKSW